MDNGGALCKNVVFSEILESAEDSNKAEESWNLGHRKVKDEQNQIFCFRTAWFRFLKNGTN